MILTAAPEPVTLTSLAETALAAATALRDALTKYHDDPPHPGAAEKRVVVALDMAWHAAASASGTLRTALAECRVIDSGSTD